MFTIAFLDPAEQTAKQLFVPATKSSMITLPAKTGAVTAAGTKGSKNSRTKKVVKRDDHLLPDDMHFTSQQLLRLFLKPKFTVCMEFLLRPAFIHTNCDPAQDASIWHGVGTAKW